MMVPELAAPGEPGRDRVMYSCANAAGGRWGETLRSEGSRPGAAALRAMRGFLVSQQQAPWFLSLQEGLLLLLSFCLRATGGRCSVSESRTQLSITRGSTVCSQLSSHRSCCDSRRFLRNWFSLPAGSGKFEKSICS